VLVLFPRIVVITVSINSSIRISINDFLILISEKSLKCLVLNGSD